MGTLSFAVCFRRCGKSADLFHFFLDLPQCLGLVIGIFDLIFVQLLFVIASLRYSIMFLSLHFIISYVNVLFYPYLQLIYGATIHYKQILIYHRAGRKSMILLEFTTGTFQLEPPSGSVLYLHQQIFLAHGKGPLALSHHLPLQRMR